MHRIKFKILCNKDELNKILNILEAFPILITKRKYCHNNKVKIKLQVVHENAKAKFYVLAHILLKETTAKIRRIKFDY